MRHPRVAALRAGFYVAIALSGFAAAYALKEWLPHLWETPPARVVPASDSPDDDEASPRSSSQQDHPPEIHARQTDEVPSPVPGPVPGPLADPDHSFPPPSPNADAPTPPTSQSKILPPLRTHSLPPPVPSGHVLLSGPSFDAIPSPTSAGSPRTLSSEDGVEGEAASQTDASDALTDSFLDVLSPSPTHVISRRRSMRAHDLFAASHISFTELGSLVAPEEDT